MLVAGLLGSPRKKGNTAFLLNTFLKTLEAKGATTIQINVPEKNILFCRGCTFCEKEGYCVQQDDDMSREIYPLLRRADVIVAATPMYFYSATAQLKALIDRSQALWSRRYKLNLNDPKSGSRAGFMLAVGATRGKNLFEGNRLTTKYFFDAVSAAYTGELCYRRVENPGDLKQNPDVETQARAEADKLDPLFNREKILFVCRENACRSKMAAAFAARLAGDRVEAVSAGSAPATGSDPDMMQVMAEKGLDMFPDPPRPIEAVLTEIKPDRIVAMGCRDQCPPVPGSEMVDWDIKDPRGLGLEVMREVRDDIEKQVRELLDRGDTGHDG